MDVYSGKIEIPETVSAEDLREIEKQLWCDDITRHSWIGKKYGDVRVLLDMDKRFWHTSSIISGVICEIECPVKHRTVRRGISVKNGVLDLVKLPAKIEELQKLYETAKEAAEKSRLQEQELTERRNNQRQIMIDAGLSAQSWGIIGEGFVYRGCDKLTLQQAIAIQKIIDGTN